MGNSSYPSMAMANSQIVDVVMASHPIFDRKMNIAAYELLFRHCYGDECAIISNYDDATNKIISDGFSLASSRLGNVIKLTVNVGIQNIISKNLLALPPSRVVFEIPSITTVSPELLDSCEELKASGYKFLIDNYTVDNPCAEELIHLASYVKIPIGKTRGRLIAGIKKFISKWDVKVIASRIEDWESFEGCKALGFDYFQGFFFARPKDIIGKKISSHKVSRLNLICMLSDENIELQKLVNAISADQAFSIRMLQFVNSAAFPLGTKVDSLARAASLVGLDSLKKWAMAAAISDLDASDKGIELSYMTIHGAIFLSKIADFLSSQQFDHDTLYLLGLLHNLDAIMSMNMIDIVKDMPINSNLKQALMRDQDEQLTQFLLLLDAICSDQWEHAREILHGIGVPLPRAAQLYMQAEHDTVNLLELTSSIS